MASRMVKRFSAVGLLFGSALVLLPAGRPVAGQSDVGDSRRLVGTWNVTLRFPVCSNECPCPGGVPNVPIPALHTYGADGSLLEAGGGSLFRGPGLGSWGHSDGQEFTAHFKFFVFNPNGSGRGSEEVTNHIDLTGQDTFDANATFDLFDSKSDRITPPQGCPINETGTRFN